MNYSKYFLIQISLISHVLLSIDEFLVGNLCVFSFLSLVIILALLTGFPKPLTFKERTLSSPCLVSINYLSCLNFVNIHPQAFS